MHTKCDWLFFFSLIFNLIMGELNIFRRVQKVIWTDFYQKKKILFQKKGKGDFINSIAFFPLERIFQQFRIPVGLGGEVRPWGPPAPAELTAERRCRRGEVEVLRQFWRPYRLMPPCCCVLRVSLVPQISPNQSRVSRVSLASEKRKENIKWYKSKNEMLYLFTRYLFFHTW